jgi:hypothetical protein
MKIVFFATCLVIASLAACPPLCRGETPIKIDRFALVARHNIERNALDRRTPLQVGNGDLAFSADVTGLQTFVPFNTMSQWAFHCDPLPPGRAIDDFKWTEVTTHGRTRRFPFDPQMDPRKGLPRYMMTNPHRINLGRLGLEMTRNDGSPARAEDLRHVHQSLDLWRGILSSRFDLDGQTVIVETCVHPEHDVIAARIDSPLIAAGRLKLFLAFPYAIGEHEAGNTYIGVWDRPDAHETTMTQQDNRADFRRRLDNDRYVASIAWEGRAALAQTGKHHYTLAPVPGANYLEVACAFAANEIPRQLPSFTATRAVCERHWAAFWQSGGAIDLSGSKDPRWRELERRIVLSQYVTAVNNCGSAPPQESGLVTTIGWAGKFHLEMTAWHGAHFALWGREEKLAGWMHWLQTIGLPAARREAKRQGYAGAKWMKMIDYHARWESPNNINPYRLTQQGHVIYLAELLYRAHPERATLQRYQELVFETADYMADFVGWDDTTGRYILGPPVVTGFEQGGAEAWNPAVELSYWAYGLRLAQEWRRRLGMPPEAKWDRVLAHLSKPPVKDGVYVDLESHPNVWRGGRPSWLEAYGCMPGTNIDPAIMDKTYRKIVGDLKPWFLWGTDFPMFALTAARLGRPQEAVDFLLYEHPANHYDTSGCCNGPYLCGNGGLLWAAALMTAGWDGGQDRAAPGFPDNGQWTVRWEGIKRTP